MTSPSHDSALALIEVDGSRPGSCHPSIILRAYTASRFGRIALVLSNIGPDEVDRILDPIVRAGPLEGHELLYVDVRNERDVRAALARAKVAVAVTEQFRAAARAHGCTVIGGEHASARLDEIFIQIGFDKGKASALRLQHA